MMTIGGEVFGFCDARAGSEDAVNIAVVPSARSEAS
jgi:hypothetical protein